jgi:hypothetical protein
VAEDFRDGAYAALGFPFHAADLGELVAFVRDSRAVEGSNGMFPINAVLDERRDAVVKAFAAMMRQINVSPDYPGLFAGSQVFNDNPGASSSLLEITADPAPAYSMQVSSQGVKWGELSPWPVAYGAFLGQMGMLVAAYATMIRSRIDDMGGTLEGQGLDRSNLNLIDQTSRSMPTVYHYAFASLGAWGGGTINQQYLAYAAISQPLDEAAVNIQLGQAIGFSEADATDLDKGGLIAIPEDIQQLVYEAQGDAMVFGGIPADEWNNANPPSPNAMDQGAALPGMVVDKQYRAAFTARRFGRQALYGSHNVPRDHYREFYDNIDVAGLIRCKHYCAPIIDISTPQDLVALVAEIPRRSDEGLFYRGQGKLHTIPRPDSVRGLLFGSSNGREPSLPTAAARRHFDYDGLHFALRYFLQDRILHERATGETFEVLAKRWGERSRSFQCELDYAVMALGQHYGIPTHGLDVTTSLDVATWFATNKWSNDGQWASYEKKPVSEWSDKPEDWPVIFACQQVTHSLGMSLRSCEELTEFGITAFRPERQSARFFLGGHSDHQNRLAEAVICAFRLRPGPWSTDASYTHLFPSSEEDTAYAAMLAFRDSGLFESFGSEEVARYRFDN